MRFCCECGRRGCQPTVELKPAEHARATEWLGRYVVARPHEEGNVVRRTERYAVVDWDEDSWA